MGNIFTTPEGDEVKVEYSFGYILDDAGNVRINFTILHALCSIIHRAHLYRKK